MHSAADLKRLAEAESLFWGTEYLQLHNEPGYFRQRVEAAARIRPELIPDANGNAPTAEKLLDTPRYIGQQIRYFINNTLVHLGTWNVIVEYLKEIENLDEKEGVPGSIFMRNKLMGAVKCLIIQEIEKLEKRVRFSIMFHPATKGHFTRVSNHDDWGGAHVQPNLNYIQEDTVHTRLMASNLAGTLMRFASPHAVFMTDREIRMDLFSQFNNATPIELDTLSEKLSDDITHLRSLHDFEEMLGHPEPVRSIPDDARYAWLVAGGKKAENIMKKSTIEKHLKSIESLEKPSMFAKIWKEIDACSQKTEKKPIGQVVGYAPPRPIWFSTPQARAPPPVSEPSEPDSAPLAATPEEALVVIDDSTAPTTPRRLPSPLERQDPTPAATVVKPYWSRTELPELDEPVPRMVPKVKTRKAPVAATTSSAAAQGGNNQASEANGAPRELPEFRVAKRVYDFFSRLFSSGKEKGDRSFKEFQYAMARLGFSMEPKGGSIVHFTPAPGLNDEKNRPFICHRPHGQRDSLDPVRLREYADSLKRSYGWTIEWFGLKADGPSDA